ncbi:hypothetical protein [Zongyangia hominis]|uniref:Uncharacterized protein n=1 Tax=Zongyangia hominis TaxID=2763677 RepID=A0A926EE97_9FIRM|nr:hypothetical protein [Zongyangia hominis]MBC8570594.1 hypothetical protein [Zongyangia hominis]
MFAPLPRSSHSNHVQNRSAVCQRTLSARQIVLFVLAGSQNAIAFYEHMGFTLTGKQLVQQTPFGDLRELEMLLLR